MTQESDNGESTTDEGKLDDLFDELENTDTPDSGKEASYEPGETVWFAHDFGHEKGEVFIHSFEKEMVAVLVGPLDMGDRYILHESEVFGSKEELEAAKGAFEG